MPKRLQNKTCAVCGKTFKPTKRGMKCCSKDCANELMRRTARAQAAEFRSSMCCFNCGAPLPKEERPGMCWICRGLPDEDARRVFRVTGTIYRRRCHRCGALTNDYICKSCRESKS